MSDPKDIMHMGAVMQLTGDETVTSKALQLKDTGDIFLQHHRLCIENTQLREQLRATQAELKSLREDFNAMRAQMQTLSGEEQAVRRP
jgi:TolA-binding protein